MHFNIFQVLQNWQREGVGSHGKHQSCWSYVKANWDVKPSLTTLGNVESRVGERAMVFASGGIWWCACSGRVEVSRKQWKVFICLMFPWDGAVLFLLCRLQTWRQMEVCTKANWSLWTPESFVWWRLSVFISCRKTKDLRNYSQPFANFPHFHPPPKSDFF